MAYHFGVLRRFVPFSLLSLLVASSAAAAEPLVVDPWLERAPPARAAAFESLSEIIDPWAGETLAALYATDDIVDPWASRSGVPTAAFPPIE